MGDRNSMMWNSIGQLIKDVVLWLKEIHSDAKGRASSKRFYGGIGFISALVLAINGISVDIIISILGISATMLGADSIADIWKKE